MTNNILASFSINCLIDVPNRLHIFVKLIRKMTCYIYLLRRKGCYSLQVGQEQDIYNFVSKKLGVTLHYGHEKMSKIVSIFIFSLYFLLGSDE